MADYIYTLETRLSPDQQKAVTLVQDAAKAAGMNLYLTGGGIRDIVTGFPIRDLDFTVQGTRSSCRKTWSGRERWWVTLTTIRRRCCSLCPAAFALRLRWRGRSITTSRGRLRRWLRLRSSTICAAAISR